MNNIPTGFFAYPPTHWPEGWKLAYQILADPVSLIYRLRERLRDETQNKLELPRFWLSDLLTYTDHVHECLGKIERAVPTLDSVGAFGTLDVACQIQKAVNPVLVELGQARRIPSDPSTEQTRQITEFRDRWLRISEKFPERLLLERLRTEAAKEIGIELETALLDRDKSTCHMGIVVPGSVVEPPVPVDEDYLEQVMRHDAERYATIGDRARQIAGRIDRLYDEVVASFQFTECRTRDRHVQLFAHQILDDMGFVMNDLEERRSVEAAKLAEHRLKQVLTDAVKCSRLEIPEFAGGVTTGKAGDHTSAGARRAAELKAYAMSVANSIRELADDFDAEDGRITLPTIDQTGAAPLKEPSKDAMTVYRYQLVTGKKQTELESDPALMKLLGKPISQGTISRWLKLVKTWIEAGNVLPDLPEHPGEEATPMDPARIDLGERQDGRTPRQRNRRSN